MLEGLRNSLKCQIEENSKKQERIHKLEQALKKTDEELNKRIQANKLLKLKYDQLDKDYERLLEVLNDRITNTKRK